jgi:acetyl esterase
LQITPHLDWNKLMCRILVVRSWLTVVILGVVAILGVAAQPLLAELPRPLEPIAAQLQPTRRLVYKTVNDTNLHLHIFEPKGHSSADQRPVFLAIHGGGWVSGSAKKFYPFANHFSQLGMVGISLEYRLLKKKTGTTVFDCVKDARSAIRYLRSHAKELGLDPNRIVVAGGSAGGHVAAGTALFDGVDQASDDASISCRPDAMILYYPVIDTSEHGYGQQKIGELWRQLSPVDHVAPDLPSTIVFHGTTDTVTPYAGAVLFQKRMLKVGNVCELISHQGGRHGYFIFDLDLYEQAMSRTHEFLVAQRILEEVVQLSE